MLVNKYRLRVIATAVASTLVVGCGDSKTSTSTTVVKAPDQVAAPVAPLSLLLVDESGQPLTVNATIVASGDDADFLIETAAGKSALATEKTFVAEGGLLSLSTSGVPAGKESLELKLVVSAPGYFATSADVELSLSDEQKGVATSLQLVLTSKDVNSDEIAIRSATQVIVVDEASGVTGAELIFGTEAVTDETKKNAKALAGGKATVVIPSSTGMTDDNDATLTGSLTAYLNYFSNEPQGTGDAAFSSLAAFPGGFTLGTFFDESGEETDADFDFVSGGFIALEITDQSGNKVKNFSQPITLSLNVPASTVNPETGNAVKFGDVVPFWSYNEVTGTWSLEGNATIGEKDDTTNTFTASMAVDHLSYWNLDWKASERCDANPINIAIENADGEANGTPFAATMKRQGGGWSRTRYANSVNGTFANLSIYRAPSFNVDLQFQANGDQLLTGITGESVKDNTYSGSLCALHNQTITLDTDRADDQAINGNFTISAVCEQDASKRTQQNGTLALYGSGYWVSANASAEEGIQLGGLKKGASYTAFYSALGLGSGKKSITITTGEVTEQSFTLDLQVECDVEQPGTGGIGSTEGSGV